MKVTRKFFFISRGYSNDGKCSKSPLLRENIAPIRVVDVILEAALNEQINRELQAGLEYLAISQYFFRNSVGLHGFGSHFIKQSNEEMQHAKQICKYQNLRGGEVKIFGLMEPKMKFKDFETCAEDALKVALKLEEEQANNLNNLYKMAESTNDLHAMDFIVKSLMQSQVEEISELHRLLAKLQNFNDKLGLFLIDKELRNKSYF